MKIAWITYDFEEYSSRHVNELARQHDVLLVMPSPEPGAPVYPIAENVRHISFDNPRLRQPFRHIATIRNLLRQVHDFSPDVVHYQQGHLWFNFALSSLKKYPLVVTIHDPRHHAGDSVSKKTPQWVMDRGFRLADHVIVHGEALKKQVCQLFGFQSRQVHVIPHVAMGGSVDANVRSATTLGNNTHGDDDAPVDSTDGCDIHEDGHNVLFFGRIWDYKGLDNLIAAEPLISQRFPDVNIVIGGEGEDFDRYRKLIQNPSRFQIHNRWISDQERAEMFQRASVVVLPYREATQSGVVPVAYNFCKPVVATRVGALAECIEHETTGLLVPPNDSQKLADAIVRVLNDPEERSRMGRAGRNRLVRESAPEVVAQQTMNVYLTAINEGDTGPVDRPSSEVEE
ncbi:MAG: glycosyltransferase family 4 protein [Planctomycetota bacterium]